MNSRTISESFQMRKNISREDKSAKRRLVDTNHDAGNSKQKMGGKSLSMDKNNFKSPVESSPIFQSQKEIVWNTISPDCFQRLQPRILDDAKIHENVENAKKSYMCNNAKPKQPKNEFLDSWLNKPDNVLSHPTTPKISKTLSRRNICKPSRDNILETKKMLERSNLKFSIPEKVATENVAELKDDGFDELWDEEELFNDSNFLAATQQVEEKYQQNKPDAQIASTSNARLEIERASNSKLNVTEENRASETVNRVDKEETLKANTVHYGEKFLKNNERSNVQHANLNESWMVDDEFDEIDKFMCTMDVPQSQAALDDTLEDIPTQPFNTELVKNPDLQMPDTREKHFNNSFDFDSDDSFGADFQV